MSKPSYVCDDCGLTFDIKMINNESVMLHGEKVTVLSFTCPHCNKKFIISVLDHNTAVLRASWLSAQRKHQDLLKSQNASAEQLRLSRHEVEFYRKKAILHMEKLKKAYMRELRKYGKC